MAARSTPSNVAHQAPPTDAAPSTAGADRPLMTMDEVIATWQDEWVLMRVLAFDLDRWPYYGEIIAHSPDRRSISDALAGEPRWSPPGSTPYYIFNAFPRVRSGPEYEAAVAKLVEQIREVQRAKRARRGR
jgi:hypothetical protein